MHAALLALGLLVASSQTDPPGHVLPPGQEARVLALLGAGEEGVTELAGWTLGDVRVGSRAIEA